MVDQSLIDFLIGYAYVAVALCVIAAIAGFVKGYLSKDSETEGNSCGGGSTRFNNTATIAISGRIFG